MLLTRSPLSPDPKVWFSLDLHVLSAPPAFVLSQDQTLREDCSPAEADESFHLELVLKVPLPKEWRQGSSNAERPKPSGLDVNARC